MEGCREEKKSANLNSIWRETKNALDFWWEKILSIEQDFSRQKTWYIFGSTLDTIQKRRLFLPQTIFPPKDFCKHF